MRRKRKTNMAGRTAQSPVCCVCPTEMYQPVPSGIDESLVQDVSSNAASPGSKYEQDDRRQDKQEMVKSYTQMQTDNPHSAINSKTISNRNAAGTLQSPKQHAIVGMQTLRLDSADTQASQITNQADTSKDDSSSEASPDIAEGCRNQLSPPQKKSMTGSTTDWTYVKESTSSVPPEYCITPGNQLPAINTTAKVQREQDGYVIEQAMSKSASCNAGNSQQEKDLDPETTRTGTMSMSADNDKMQEGVRHETEPEQSGCRINLTLPYQGSNLMAKITSRRNLLLAIKHVRKSGAKAGGIDGKTTKQVCKETISQLDALALALNEGRYCPSPGLRVWVPKESGKLRGLSIPIVLDRIVARAIQQVIEPMLDLALHPFVHGFRPGRDVFSAAWQNKELIDDGYGWVVKLDIEKFFDTTDHLILMEKVRQLTDDQILLELIWRFLKAGVMDGGRFIPSGVGLQQGVPLSPPLSNVFLHELDWFLENKGHKFTRFADDLTIFARSRDAAIQIKNQTTDYLQDKMHLKVSEAKSAVIPATELSSLGLAFENGSISISEDTAEKFQKRIGKLTTPANTDTIDFQMLKATQWIKGWATHCGRTPDRRRVTEMMKWAREKIKGIRDKTGLPSTVLVIKTVDEWLDQQEETILS